MLSAALHMLSAAAVIGLKPTWEAFDPSSYESSVTFDFHRATCSRYKRDHHKPILNI